MPRAVRLAAVAALAVGGWLGLPAAAQPGGAHTAAASPALGIRHVFVIVLENESYDAAYAANPNPWLGRILQRQGTLLTGYYGTAHESNPNYVALLSGQAPNPDNQSDCQYYSDFQPSPGIVATNGQAVGIGCVYPPAVKTLADQLQASHLTWRGYMEDMGSDPAREPARCGRPAASSAGLGARDVTQTATASDQYAARHNPFVYFHSLIDSGACARNVVPLSALAADLRRAATTPNFSFITPDLCDDGHDAPCTGPDTLGSKAGGLVSADHFLSVWVPRIERSPAFRKDGLLVIVSDESDLNQHGADASSCCGEQPGPGSPLPGIVGPGGGRTGALVIGRCVRRGARDASPYNHYALLRTLEDLFGIRTGGSDGKGHLGYAGAAGLAAFGPDVFARCARDGP